MISKIKIFRSSETKTL